MLTQHVVLDLPRLELPAKQRDAGVVLYDWNAATRPSVNMWLRGADQPGLKSLDLLFYYVHPASKSRCIKIGKVERIFVCNWKAET